MKFSREALFIVAVAATLGSSTVSAFVAPGNFLTRPSVVQSALQVIKDPTETDSNDPQNTEDEIVVANKGTAPSIDSEPDSESTPAIEKVDPRMRIEPGRYNDLDYSITLPFWERPVNLDGSHAGDYGFDPMGLSEDNDLYYMQECEIRHARLAMLAVAGWPLSELLAPKWMLQDGCAPSVLNGFNPLSLAATAAAFAAFGFLEFQTSLRRVKGTTLGDKHASDMQDVWKYGVAGDYNFDPANFYSLLGDDAAGRKGLRTLEITQGRYAMLGISYFALYENLTGHPIVENSMFFHPNILLPLLAVSAFAWKQIYQVSDLREFPINIEYTKDGEQLLADFDRATEGPKKELSAAVGNLLGDVKVPDIDLDNLDGKTIAKGVGALGLAATAAGVISLTVFPNKQQQAAPPAPVAIVKKTSAKVNTAAPAKATSALDSFAEKAKAAQKELDQKAEAKAQAEAKAAADKRTADARARVEAKAVADRKASAEAKAVADGKASAEAKAIADKKAIVADQMAVDAEAKAAPQKLAFPSLGSDKLTFGSVGGSASSNEKSAADEVNAKAEAKAVADKKAAAKAAADAQAEADANAAAAQKAARVEAKDVADRKASAEAKAIADKKAIVADQVAVDAEAKAAPQKLAFPSLGSDKLTFPSLGSDKLTFGSVGGSASSNEKSTADEVNAKAEAKAVADKKAAAKAAADAQAEADANAAAAQKASNAKIDADQKAADAANTRAEQAANAKINADQKAADAANTRAEQAAAQRAAVLEKREKAATEVAKAQERAAERKAEAEATIAKAKVRIEEKRVETAAKAQEQAIVVNKAKLEAQEKFRSNAFGVTTNKDKEYGGKILPKEEVSDEVKDLLKQYTIQQF